MKRVRDELKADYESKIDPIRDRLSKVASDVKQTATGNYDMLTLGAMSLFIGVALSSFPAETLHLGQWFRALWS